MLLAAVIAPSPAPTATPAVQSSLSGTLRFYDFQRINAVGTNQRATNFGGALHGELTTAGRPFTLGLTEYFAEPRNLNGVDPASNPRVDNTLPGFSYRSLGEAYVQYRTWHDLIIAGKTQLFTPFANPADGRLIPVTFQGVAGRHYFGDGWNLSLARIARFKSRTNPTFEANNLLTNARTPGFLYLGIERTTDTLSASLHQYWFYDVASLTYGQARYALSERAFVSGQVALEENTGRSLVGPIVDHLWGAAFGTRVGTVNASIGYNNVHGPLLSPYTDGYVADPLFTTSIATSLVDRRASGSAIRVALERASTDGRLDALVAHTHFAFGEGIGVADESDADLTYLLGRIDPVLPYRGFSLRLRWAYRTTSGPPLRFIYSRSQLQYVF